MPFSVSKRQNVLISRQSPFRNDYKTTLYTTLSSMLYMLTEKR